MKVPLFMVIVYSYRRQSNKRNGEWYAIPIKEAKTFGYIQDLQAEIVTARRTDMVAMSRRREMEPEDPRPISATLSKIPPRPTKVLIAEREKHSHYPKKEMLVR